MLVGDPLDEARQREMSCVIQESTGQRDGDRQGNEQKQECAAEDHGTGDESIAAKAAERRTGGPEEHDEGQQRQRPTPTDAWLPRGERSEGGSEPCEGPPHRTNGKAAAQYSGQAQYGPACSEPAA